MPASASPHIQINLYFRSMKFHVQYPSVTCFTPLRLRTGGSQTDFAPSCVPDTVKTVDFVPSCVPDTVKTVDFSLSCIPDTVKTDFQH
jgi:hypothetical protein